MANGIVKWFNRKKGYGIITPDKDKEVFFNYKGIVEDENGFRTLNEGAKVDLEIFEDKVIRKAINVKILEKLK